MLVHTLCSTSPQGSCPLLAIREPEVQVVDVGVTPGAFLSRETTPWHPMGAFATTAWGLDAPVSLGPLCPGFAPHRAEIEGSHV